MSLFTCGSLFVASAIIAPRRCAILCSPDVRCPNKKLGCFPMSHLAILFGPAASGGGAFSRVLCFCVAARYVALNACLERTLDNVYIGWTEGELMCGDHRLRLRRSGHLFGNLGIAA